MEIKKTTEYTFTVSQYELWILRNALGLFVGKFSAGYQTPVRQSVRGHFKGT